MDEFLEFLKKQLLEKIRKSKRNSKDVSVRNPAEAIGGIRERRHGRPLEGTPTGIPKRTPGGTPVGTPGEILDESQKDFLEEYLIEESQKKFLAITQTHIWKYLRKDFWGNSRINSCRNFRNFQEFLDAFKKKIEEFT